MPDLVLDSERDYVKQHYKCYICSGDLNVDFELLYDQSILAICNQKDHDFEYRFANAVGIKRFTVLVQRLEFGLNDFEYVVLAELCGKEDPGIWEYHISKKNIYTGIISKIFLSNINLLSKRFNAKKLAKKIDDAMLLV